MRTQDFELKFMPLPDGTNLVSWHRHDFKTKVIDEKYYIIDGGQEDYVRFSHPTNSNPIVREKLENCIEWVREEFTWTKKYDANQNLLPKAVTAKLKDLTNSHLEALVEYRKNSYMTHLFKMELIYRQKLSL